MLKIGSFFIVYDEGKSEKVTNPDSRLNGELLLLMLFSEHQSTNGTADVLWTVERFLL